jgi:hypothetical protein
MKETIAIVASILAIVGNVPYLYDIVRKKVQPHPFTWLVWSIISCIIFFGQVAKGAGIGALPTAASEVFTIIIFFFSLRYGFKNVRKIDTVFLVIALLGIIPWILTSDPTVSVIIAVSIDLVAFVPTIRKTWRHPETETPLLYMTNVLRHILMLFALRTYNVATALHSIVMITTNTLMTGILVTKRKNT